ncbi:NACHT and WD repeat domain-containing protein 2 [Aplysia californica]|uniref:NACHT and WD repeat domain-containing protein 2 n=1 Tax=Aplysia californica TaxID=6500 RepID=A0ABM1A6N8_APLCA|nr:NACHT and WD repeat domain-containing protein 2 [Aplysia californica]
MAAELLSPRDLHLLAGTLTQEEIPAVKAHVIRVYVCSVGTDSMTERDQFVQKVYPRLRHYCKHKYGLEFQVVDLAWGLCPEEIDRQTDVTLTPLRIREIQRCHALSAGPNFVAFVGQRYGPRSLPDVILGEEYDVIRLALHTHKGRDTRNAPFLDTCYVMDDNNIPPVYVLKDRTSLVPDLCDNDEEVRKAAIQKWEEVQAEIRTLLRRGAELALQDGTMDGETKDRYFFSELENQMMLGVEGNDLPARRCLLITRDIADLQNYTLDPRTPRFAELTHDPREDSYHIDPDSSNMLVRLKNRTRGLVSELNTLHHDVLWRYGDVISPQLHADYLAALNEQLYRACVRLIDDTAPTPETTTLPASCEEALQHWSRCRYMASHFYSQEAILSAVTRYVMGDDTTPIVLYGAHGGGKSKIISKLAFEMNNHLHHTDYMVLLRYIGYTTKSRDLRQLLISLCAQVAMATGGSEDAVPTEMKELLKYFSDMLTSVPTSRRLIILLDGLELLTSEHQDQVTSWIPQCLQPNVKLVITVHKTANDLLTHIRQNILRDPACFLEVMSITVDECEGLLTSLLAAMDRSVTPAQMAVFRRALEREPLPLYVELLANIAKDLNSFNEVDLASLPRDCEEGITKLLDRLETKHGTTLVSRAFGYMVASGTGLSDCEMEDILSLDDDVLHEVFGEFRPAVRRIPYIKWLALKQDVEAFLVYRDADGVTVAIWQHDRFLHAVQQRYLSNAETLCQVHSNIADYFLGTWAGRAKPVVVTSEKTGGVASYEADRLVPAQPHTFGEEEAEDEGMGGGDGGEGGGGGGRFNKRKYDQVPRHLDLSGRHKELNSLIFFNYEWLYNKLKALSLQHIIADFALQPSPESCLVEEALRVSEAVIERDLNSLPAEISGHLLPYYTTHPNIRSLIRQCDHDGIRHCAIVPNFPYLQVPGSSLQFILDCPCASDQLSLTADDRFLLCKKRDDPYVHSFDLRTGELQESVFTSTGELYTTPDGKYHIVVDHVTEKTIKIHESTTGAFLQQIIVLNHIEGKSRLYKKGPVSLTNDRLCTVATLTNSVLCVCEIPSGQVLHVITLDGKSDLCAMTPDGHRVFCNSNSFLVAYDVYSMRHLLTIPLGARPTRIIFTHDGLRAFLSNDKDTRLTIMHLSGDAIDMTYRAVLEEKMPGDRILELTISPNDALLLVRGAKTLLVYHRGLEKVIATFGKPDDIPDEFRLPRSHYVPMAFAHAHFTHDSNYVIGTIFRTVYVWQISNSSLVTSIQAPIGLMSQVLVAGSRPQLITHMEGSLHVQVWNIGDAVRKVNTPDKLTDAISEFQVSADNNTAFIRCRHSDELGVVDMTSGSMVDLLTHDTPVEDFAISPDGGWLLVSTRPRLRGTAFKLWNLEARQLVLETGDTSGYCVATHHTPCIVMVAQTDRSFGAPYHISVLQLTGDEFYQHVYMQSVDVIRAKPLVTRDDQYLVVSSAAQFDQSTGTFSSPQVCAFNMQDGMSMTSYDAVSLKFEEHLEDILEVRECPMPYKGSVVAAIFSCKDHISESDSFNTPHTPHTPHTDTPDAPTLRTHGLFFLDLSTGSPLLLCIPFPRPSYGVGTSPLVFSRDLTLCLDQSSNIFHVPSGEFIGQVPSPALPPRAMALDGRAVLYYSGSLLHAVRLSDGAVLASCEVHAPVCRLHVCEDEHTVLVGCHDGTVMSYTLVDPQHGNAAIVLSKVGSRKVAYPEEIFDRSLSRRSWDKSEPAGSYSRPPSAISPGPRDKILLRQVKAVPRKRFSVDTSSPQSSVKSQTCGLM